MDEGVPGGGMCKGPAARGTRTLCSEAGRTRGTWEMISDALRAGALVSPREERPARGSGRGLIRFE